MGFDHMALVRQNTPYITKGGPLQGLDLRFLLMVAEKIPASRETAEWFMPMSEIKEHLRMRPETREADIIRIYKHLMELGYLKVRNGTGRGRMANTYILTDTIMKGHVPPERKAAVRTAESGGDHVCKCKGKSHTNKGACATFQHRAKYGRRERVKGKKAKTGRANPCSCPGKDHKTDGACDTWRWRNKGTVPQSAATSAPKPPTETELQAQAEAKERREARQAEAKKARETAAKRAREWECRCPELSNHQTERECDRADEAYGRTPAQLAAKAARK